MGKAGVGLRQNKVDGWALTLLRCNAGSAGVAPFVGCASVQLEPLHGQRGGALETPFVPRRNRCGDVAAWHGQDEGVRDSKRPVGSRMGTER